MQINDRELRQKLTAKQYAVLREGATEPAFTGALLHNDISGEYNCAACGSVLFDSMTKFDSGSGWPSFYDVKQSEAIKLLDDSTLGMERVEARCATCDSHLGHVFNDAYDQPTGKRYCINSAALSFHAKEPK